ncbi:tRNA pseudouridine(38-40) synthase TruA [Methanobacterium alcaliphilum]|uniref:tRNA pseudouridine(38-40) synthase TruA n=1 Tax=Methanobacterium alcaliphilum TaxID=392018 RepID=UPI00200A8FCF|nr:tRNA pseudouridine(38-40) synthase TruA [Methanobacterium alcaliphilum]MCK9150906.1 tRNA pseudouridine(38-40) synthase TruA [Methanobacterium alcaliphilum]
MKKVALKIAYIGTNFHGFQRQLDVRTVEGELIRTLKEMRLIDDLKKAYFAISGRTDRGVHALGNVVTFMSENEVIINQINDALPSDVQILAKTPVHYGFRPRYANTRHYRYIIMDCNELDINKMSEAGDYFKGAHDFSNFSKRSERNPIRTVDEVSVVKNGPLICVDVKGESFLWNMVRKMVRVLYDVGNNQKDSSVVIDYLNPNNFMPIKPMPPECLILMDVGYKNLNFEYDSYACSRFKSTLKTELIKHRTKVLVEKTMIDGINEFCSHRND